MTDMIIAGIVLGAWSLLSVPLALLVAPAIGGRQRADCSAWVPEATADLQALPQ